MDTDEQASTRRRLRRFASDRAKLAQAEVETIVEALRLGIRQVDVVREVDRSREYVRRVAREAERDGRLPSRPED